MRLKKLFKALGGGGGNILSGYAIITKCCYILMDGTLSRDHHDQYIVTVEKQQSQML